MLGLKPSLGPWRTALRGWSQVLVLEATLERVGGFSSWFGLSPPSIVLALSVASTNALEVHLGPGIIATLRQVWLGLQSERCPIGRSRLSGVLAAGSALGAACSKT